MCGPMSTLSLNGSRYFLLFIDDYSRMCWVYFMKEKSEVFCIFKRFKQLVEKQVDKQIKILRTNNGGEFALREFNSFCEIEGIQFQLIIPYSPQKNGESEQKNRTVMEMARCLIFEKDLPLKFWAEAVNTSVYLLNLLPTKALKGKTSFEAWHGEKASVQHLRVFGCVCYTLVPTERRNKLDHKAEAAIFLGYSSYSKGYRVYSLKSEKVIVSRDVKFDEFSKWDWNRNEVVNIEKGHDATSTSNLNAPAEMEVSDIIDHVAIRGTRTLEDIFERCNVASFEPSSYSEASTKEEWRAAMKEEIDVINREPSR